MKAASIIEEIELIAEIGEAEDALDLSKRLIGDEQTAWAIDVRRAVTRDVLDRNVLRAVAGRIAEAMKPTVDWGLFADRLVDMEAGLRAFLAADAAMPRAERRERSAQQWVAQQRFEERVSDCNAQVEFVNRERGRAHNKAQAAAVRAKTCAKCFQVPAANGECGC
ncbi:hypothetical protein ABZ464_23700 [Streptomyces sp. NPDC005820]|uniref:hypothetical protein n=1 Tax=Streptomyces sp. NPDC005820 TaxID=3157069 RepID=UPI00340103F6